MATDEPLPVTDLRPAYQALQNAVNANLEALQKAGLPRIVVEEPTAIKLRPGDQQLPVKNDAQDVQSQVIADIEERRQLGISRYGTALQPFNGRNSTQDAYEEALDLVIYWKQWLIERDQLLARIAELEDRVAQQDAVLESLRYGD